MRLSLPLAVVLALLAGGCAETPRPPLYSSLQATGRFGYFEEQLGDRRYRVSYTAPIERAYSLSPAERRRQADRLVELAYDLALMRAAELALAEGAASFDVGQRENTVEIDVHHEYGYDPFLAPWPYWHSRYRYMPYPYPGPLPPYYDRQTEVAAGVSFVATLRDSGTGGEFDARATLARLQAKYPTARAAT